MHYVLSSAAGSVKSFSAGQWIEAAGWKSRRLWRKDSSREFPLHCPSTWGAPGQPGPRAENRERGYRKMKRHGNFGLTVVSFRSMPEEPQKGTKTQLAIALARGMSIRGWAKANKVPRMTAAVVGRSSGP